MSNQDTVAAHKSSAIVAVIIAVMVAILLVGLGYLAFEASDINNTTKAKDKTTSGTTADALPAATEPNDSDDIKKQIKQLTEEFSDSGAEDFDAELFSNQSLGI